MSTIFVACTDLMTEILLCIPRLVLFGVSEVACRLLGLGPPPKRKPEDMFRDRGKEMSTMIELSIAERDLCR